MKNNRKISRVCGSALILLLTYFMSGCSGNLDYVKEHADETWERVGFKVVGYEGYKWGGIQGSFTNYGGANVWYNLEKIDGNGIIYNGCLIRWGDEIHTYNVKAIDALQP